MKRRNQQKNNKPLPESFFLFHATIKNEEIVFRYSGEARRYGIFAGMPLSQALSRLPSAQCFKFEQELEEKLLTRLALWANKFSPLVYFNRQEYRENILDIRYSGIVIDIGGSLYLFGGEQALLDKVISELQSFSLSVRIAIAPTYAAAWALARYGQFSPLICEANNLSALLLRLPLSALRIDHQLETALKEVNIKYIGELVKIPKEQLLIRFGPQVLTKLEQLFSFSEPQESLCPQEFFCTKQSLEHPLKDKSALERYTALSLDELIDEKLPAYLAIAKLELIFTGINRQKFTKTLLLTAPSRNKTHLLALIRIAIENVSFSTAIENIELIVR
ncbi:MAG: DNA polymerase Y family protein [Deltaproteobacteria bacterium]|nr:DNA polymerase Y family protein [Deltaproteobacteria bacterium]